MGFWLDNNAMIRRAEGLLAQVGANLDVTLPIRELTTGQEQMVQIAAAVGAGASVLVFDEPTASLSEPEAQSLFALIQRLKARGVTLIYVSHRMPEVLALSDRISVLRDGKYIGTLNRADATQDRVVQMMIGRPLGDYYPSHLSGTPGPVRLNVDHLSSAGLFKDVSFSVRAGEIVGLAGLVGAGRSEVAQAIFGIDGQAEGRVEVDGTLSPLGSVRSALGLGIGLVPEDRKRQGLVLMMSGRENFSMASLEKFCAAIPGLRWLVKGKELSETQRYFEMLRVKTPSIQTPVAALSGGNQQKIVIAKWLARECRILIIDEPTRGVDVGSKAAIHSLIDELAGKGVAVLLISSDLPEALNLSTRVLVMREGRIVGDVPRSDATQDRILRLMTGVEPL